MTISFIEKDGEAFIVIAIDKIVVVEELGRIVNVHLTEGLTCRIQSSDKDSLACEIRSAIDNPNADTEDGYVFHVNSIEVSKR